MNIGIILTGVGEQGFGCSRQIWGLWNGLKENNADNAADDYQPFEEESHNKKLGKCILTY